MQLTRSTKTLLLFKEDGGVFILLTFGCTGAGCGTWDPRYVARAQRLGRGLSWSEVCGILVPRPETEFSSPALGGGFSATGPPESPPPLACPVEHSMPSRVILVDLTLLCFCTSHSPHAAKWRRRRTVLLCELFIPFWERRREPGAVDEGPLPPWGDWRGPQITTGMRFFGRP